MTVDLALRVLLTVVVITYVIGWFAIRLLLDLEFSMTYLVVGATALTAYLFWNYIGALT